MSLWPKQINDRTLNAPFGRANAFQSIDTSNSSEQEREGKRDIEMKQENSIDLLVSFVGLAAFDPKPIDFNRKSSSQSLNIVCDASIASLLISLTLSSFASSWIINSFVGFALDQNLKNLLRFCDRIVSKWGVVDRMKWSPGETDWNWVNYENINNRTMRRLCHVKLRTI